jgi:hypothetical protein
MGLKFVRFPLQLREIFRGNGWPVVLNMVLPARGDGVTSETGGSAGTGPGTAMWPPRPTGLVYLPVNAGFLFSRKAFIPSFWSSVLKHWAQHSTSIRQALSSARS